MASEDVIELGSSDDEAEPAPKKKKPMPNAMVHIPTKLPGITIKPAKFNYSSAPLISINPSRGFNDAKGVLSKPIMISKTNLNLNTNINKHKPYSIPLHVPVMRNVPKIIRTAPSNPNKFSRNPISVAQNIKKSEIVITKVASNRRLKNPLVVNNISYSNNQQGSRLLNNLPPDITIKPIAHAGASGINKKRKIHALRNALVELLTVEIDDAEAAETSIGSPQWYLRPEEQEDDKNLTKDNTEEFDKCEDKIEPSMEEQNNKEPETPNFVEITIEDSPVKALQLKNRCEIGKELAITIEDSPVKIIENKDDNIDSAQNLDRIPQSKKKLNYPKESSTVRQVVEIEIDLMDTDPMNCNDNVNANSEQISLDISNQDKLKNLPDQEKTISKIEANVITDSKDDSGNCEFHPVYQDFIDTCFKLENSKDMKKIVEKKIKAYYKQCSKEYIESEEFIDMVSSKIVSMKAAPDKMYLYIKDIVDELNLLRKMKKTISSKTTDTVQESDKGIYGEESEYDSKRQRQIRKLEKTIKKLHRAIQILEEQEVDFEDDEDSVFLLTERYKERMVRVHAKFCQLTNTKMPSEPCIHLEVRPGKPAGPVRKLEKWINRKVPIGAPLPFPDFHDVLLCVRQANDEDKLGWNEVDVMEEARDLFIRCGRKLQRRRQENEWRLAISRISHNADPADESAFLKKKLDENKSIGSKTEAELLNKYVDKQNQLNLVPEEIGDKEAEESPIESEEEELSEDVNSLVHKQKRKERLKRLLQENNRKTEEKENNCEEKKESNIKEKYEQSKHIESETKCQDDNLNKIDIAVNNDQIIPAVDGVSDHVNENSEKNLENKKDENDENEFKSDKDELNLLQKLHSENESDVSAYESSDSDIPIVISDTLESDSEAENKNYLSDVISIENSSYSESEDTVHGFSKENENVSKKSIAGSKYFAKNPFQTMRSENKIENILFASSDDESSNKFAEYDGTSINLRDDDISISETTIDGVVSLKENVDDEKNMLEKNNASFIQKDSVIDKLSHAQDNNSSDVNDATNSDTFLKSNNDIQMMSDTRSVDNVVLRIKQNEAVIDSRQNDSSENMKSNKTEPSEGNENKESDMQNNSVQMKSSTVNIETANDNMDTE